MEKLILLHPNDNVLIARETIAVGEQSVFDGKKLTFENEIKLGHKVARKDLQPGDKIIKYGVPIGSATATIPAGAHIHLHNMKSDYIPTYTLEKEFFYDNKPNV